MNQENDAFPQTGPSVVVISHGFQTHYESGFVTGLADNGAKVLLVGSDETDRAHLPSSVRIVNLRGSQDPNRSRFRKAANLLGYHCRLLALVVRHRSAIVHTIGLLTPLFLVGVLENLLFRLIARRLVVTVHNILPHDQHTWLNRKLARIAYRVPSTLMVHTVETKRRLVEQFGVPARNVVVIQHGLNVHFTGTEVTRTEARSMLGLGAAETVVLFFGVWAPYKGLDVLVRAFSDMDDTWRLMIVGVPSNPEYRETVLALVEASPRKGAISVVDRFVRDDEIPTYFMAADLCAMPYRHIDQSGVVFTAFIFGTPLLVTDVGDFRSYVDERVGLIVPRATERCVSDGLRLFQSTSANYDRDSIRHGSRKYQWQSTVLPLFPVYQGFDPTS